MPDSVPPVPSEVRDELIRSFEAMGSTVFNIDRDRDLYETLMEYTSKYRICTTTDVDEDARTIIVSRRPFGSLEFG